MSDAKDPSVGRGEEEGDESNLLEEIAPNHSEENGPLVDNEEVNMDDVQEETYLDEDAEEPQDVDENSMDIIMEPSDTPEANVNDPLQSTSDDITESNDLDNDKSADDAMELDSVDESQNHDKSENVEEIQTDDVQSPKQQEPTNNNGESCADTDDGSNENANENEIEVIENAENNLEQEVNTADTSPQQSKDNGIEEETQLQLAPDIFEIEDGNESDDKEHDQTIDIQSMMQVDLQEDEAETQEPEVVTPSRRPRRAAAAAAVETIRSLSHVEKDIDVDDGDIEEYASSASSRDYMKKKCSMCKKWVTDPKINVQQFGTTLNLCSNECFNKLRKNNEVDNFDTSKLPCAKCGVLSRKGERTKVFFWETMNFCSEACVGNYQLDVGKRCATCSKQVNWESLGKYCVRFGSDIRQFCSAHCLDCYKKNARVCFHCQLDIKRQGNVVLANIPNKSTPKEFCSQECIEMYVEGDVAKAIAAKQRLFVNCSVCGNCNSCYKELITSTGASKVCSRDCWMSLISKYNRAPPKCPICPKFVVFEDMEPPANYLSCESRVYVFCSATCKNIFVLKQRQILSCVTCKVKKYNYDLVQLFTATTLEYAVCSLNCLPRSATFINILRAGVFGDSAQVSRKTSKVTQSSATSTLNRSPVICSKSLPSEVTVVDLTPEAYKSLENTPATSILLRNNSGSFVEIDPTEFEEWDGVLREEEIDEFLDTFFPEVCDKSTMVRPKFRSKDTQTDESELQDMERIPWKVKEKIKYVPFPMPIPVFIPTPVYMMEVPVPTPFPVPIPYPVPIVINSESGSSPKDDKLGRDSVRNHCDVAKANDDSNSGILSPSTSNSDFTPTPNETPTSSQQTRRKLSRVEYGLKAWRMLYGQTPDADILTLSSSKLAEKLTEWARKASKPTGEKYKADVLLFLCLGLQEHLSKNGKTDNIFYDDIYEPFVEVVTNYAESDCAQGISARIEDFHFWETNQLGIFSPGVLLCTLVYLFYRNFHLKSWEKYHDIKFDNVLICETPEGRILKFSSDESEEEMKVSESEEPVGKCLVKTVEFYMSKCESTNGPFFKAFKPNYDDADKWFTDEQLDQMKLYQILVRVMMLK